MKLAPVYLTLQKLCKIWQFNTEIKKYSKQERTENPEETSKFKSFLNSFLADILLFTATLITLIITLVIIYVMHGQSKLKALVTNIVMQ